jgi:hypothetical protein
MRLTISQQLVFPKLSENCNLSYRELYIVLKDTGTVTQDLLLIIFVFFRYRYSYYSTFTAHCKNRQDVPNS